MQMGLSEDDKDFKPKFTREQAKEMFRYMEEMKFETMDKLSKVQIDPHDQ